MNTNKYSFIKFLSLFCAALLPVVLGACSSSSSSAPPPAPPTATLPVATLAGDVATTEGDSGTTTITFTVQLDKTADGPVTVEYATADGTATAGTDYVASSGTVTISPSKTTKTIDVTVNGDIKYEADETLKLSISNTSSNATLGTAISATGTITNDDAAPIVLFIADKDTDSVNELYMYSMDGSGPTRVNSTLVAGGNVTSFAMSPDRNWIAYVADQASDEIFELYVVPADLSSAPVRVSRDTPVANGDVSDNPLWAPDSTLIAYRNDQFVDEKFDLSVAVPTGAGNPVIVSPIPGFGPGNVPADSFSWAPDSARIALLSDSATAAGLYDIYSCTTDGATQTLINQALVPGKQITDVSWAPTSATIAYRSNQGTSSEWQLWTSPATGGATDVGGTSGTTNTGVQAGSIAWAPDSSRLAYIADIATGDVFNLHTVQPGTPASRVAVSTGVTGQKDVIGPPSWAPDSSRIAYLADINVNNTNELFTSVPTVAGSTNVNDPLAGGEVSVGPASSAPAWSPDSASLIYAAEQDTAGVVEIYTAAADGSGSTKVSGAMAHAAGDASLSGDRESWSPDGSQILYRADQLVDGTEELWTSRSSGALTNTVLTKSPPIEPTALKGFGKWSPESSYVAYASSQDTAGKVELFVADPAGMITTVSGTLVAGGNVDPDTFVWAP